MKVFCIDRKRKFIFAKLKDIYNKKGILIKYITFYIQKENGLAERG